MRARHITVGDRVQPNLAIGYCQIASEFQAEYAGKLRS